MTTMRLFTVKDMAGITGLSKNHLQRLATRRRLEVNGCPAPLMDRPLRWSGPAVERWINGGDGTAEPTVSPINERAAWRAKMAEEYGAP